MTRRSLKEQFSQPLLTWFEQFGRKDLPWQHPRSPYRIWVSEIMLQQTQVKTVIPYFNRFLSRYSTVSDLASACEDEVLSYWSGLGYYSRAHNLIKTAKIICEEYGGEFPKDLKQLSSLPGIGPSTAAAIASQAFHLPTPILDGNVKRVLCRYFAVDGLPNSSSVQKYLWDLAGQCMPETQCADYTQAIMDLGATCCRARAPECARCPLQATCLARLNNKVDQYPYKKSKKKLPIKDTIFLLFYDKDKLFLEKRPTSGLWGGLWCMPMIDDGVSAEAHIRATYDFEVLNIDELTKLKHTFSHFHLRITVLSIHVKQATENVTGLNGQWVKVSEIHQLGLASPTMSIIDAFIAQRYFL